MQSDQGFSVSDELGLTHQQECVKPRDDLWKQTTSLVVSSGVLYIVQSPFVISFQQNTIG